MSESAIQAPTHEVILTDVAAAKVKSLLEQEGRDDLRRASPFSPVAAPASSTSCTSTIACSTATRFVPSTALRSSLIA